MNATLKEHFDKIALGLIAVGVIVIIIMLAVRTSGTPAALNGISGQMDYVVEQAQCVTDAQADGKSITVTVSGYVYIMGDKSITLVDVANPGTDSHITVSAAWSSKNAVPDGLALGDRITISGKLDEVHKSSLSLVNATTVKYDKQ